MPKNAMPTAERRYNRAIGEQVEEARRAAGLSQHELAARVGMNQAVYSRCVVGEQRWMVFRLRLLAKELRVPIQCLLPQIGELCQRSVARP